MGCALNFDLLREVFTSSWGIELGVGCCFFRNYQPFLLGFSVFACKNVQKGGLGFLLLRVGSVQPSGGEKITIYKKHLPKRPFFRKNEVILVREWYRHATDMLPTCYRLKPVFMSLACRYHTESMPTACQKILIFSPTGI